MKDLTKEEWTIRKTPSEKWRELERYILDEINKIDKETRWSEVEPEWWLDMMRVKAEILGRPN